MSQTSATAKPENGLITGMGAALVDLFAAVSEDELTALGSPKASMSLIDAAQSTALQEKGQRRYAPARRLDCQFDCRHGGAWHGDRLYRQNRQ